MSSWFEVGADSAAESWRTIRAYRARPPAALRRRLNGRRGTVFHAGLEQAQQQFAAAASVGYESRPVNLFYGLAQAGRAIAAASPHLDGAAAWEGDQHGLRFTTGYDEEAGILTAPIDLRPGEHDLFSRATTAIGIAARPDSLTLDELFACIPEIQARYGPFTARPALRSPYSSSPNSFTLSSPHALGMLLGVPTDRPFTVAEADSLWASNPALEPLPRPATRADDPNLVQLTRTPGHPIVLVHSRDDVVLHHGAWHPAKSVTYRGARWLLPYLGQARLAMQPLIVWWLILYACSVLSRYEVSRWTRLLDLRRSTHTSLLEYTLDLALDAVPDVIAAALHDLPTSGQAAG